MGKIIPEECIVEFFDGYYPTVCDIENVIRYVWRMAYCAPYGAVGIYPLTCEKACNAYVFVQEWYRKTDGRRVMHMMVSFPRKTVITEVESYAKKMVTEIGKRYQLVWGLHTDTPNLHIHLAINAVSFVDGKKITEEQIKEMID